VANFSKNAKKVAQPGLRGFNTCQFDETKLSICRLISEQNYSEKRSSRKSTFFDDALKTRGTIYLNVETWLLFALPIKISGYKLCSTGVITIQYLLLTFIESVQTLFIRR